MWIYISFVIITLFVLYKERQALGCHNFFEGKDCDNKNGKAVKGCYPNEEDPTEDIFEKLDFASEYQDRFVTWRLNFLLSLISTIIVWFLIFKRFPKERELSISVFAMFFVLNSSVSFYKFHLHNHIKNGIKESTKLLRKRIN